MAKYKHKKQLGQNFLNNPRVIQQIVACINPKAEQHLVEIGPGKAALTEPLLKMVKKLDIIEIDRDLIEPLIKRFHTNTVNTVLNLHHNDALSFDYSQLLASKTSTIRVVGNLPYNISSQLMFHLLNYANNIQDMHFMLQKEVVDRITAQPGSKTYGRLSVMLQYYCFTEFLFYVGPENFTPTPKVDSAIVRLTPYKEKPFKVNNEIDFTNFVRQSFSQKRKTLRNNLKGWLNDESIEQCNIDPSIRAERLSVENFVNLCNIYSDLSPVSVRTHRAQALD